MKSLTKRHNVVKTCLAIANAEGYNDNFNVFYSDKDENGNEKVWLHDYDNGMCISIVLDYKNDKYYLMEH